MVNTVIIYLFFQKNKIHLSEIRQNKQNNNYDNHTIFRT